MKRKKHGLYVKFVLCIFLIMVISSTIIYAYLSASTAPLINKFDFESSVNPTVSETFTDSKEKTNVRIDVNNPGYSVYVRAKILVNWKKDNGNVHAIAPIAGTDYAININDSAWVLGSDGFYYHKNPVAYDGVNENTKFTSVLINSCTQTVSAPGDYKLHVEIMSQTIQALGTTDADDSVAAVEDTWGVTLDSSGSIVSAP